MNEYLLYRQGTISEKAYCARARPLDEAIDKLELQSLSFHLQGTLASEIPFLKHLY